jgi:hypothetical protein
VQSISSLRSQIRVLKNKLAQKYNTNIIAERLWFGIASREDVIVMELAPDRKTGLPRKDAPVSALKLLDVVTFPFMLRDRMELPTSHSFCWKLDGWTARELIDFFDWFESRDSDLYDLEDDIADRYRDQLRSASVAWLGDEIVTEWFFGRIALGHGPSESLAYMLDQDNRSEVLGELTDMASEISSVK